MLAILVEAVLRSLILALAVWAGLRIFRVQDVVSQRYAWTAVLAGALLMPSALPCAMRWHIFPRATISAPASLEPIQAALTPMTPAPSGAAASAGARSVGSQPDPGRRFRVERAAGRNLDHAPSSASAPPRGAKWSPFGVALWAYSLIAAALLGRLALGIAGAIRLWRSSNPAALGGAARTGVDFELRVSNRISAPVTIGSGVVLPADYAGWSEEKLRIVLAHERSHVSLRDFHWQILASLYAALTWFSPLGWWLKRKLSDLGEAISDRSGLQAASNRSAYAQILLEFAAAPRPALEGVAMARPSTIARRIDQLFNDSYLRQAFAGGRGARIAVLVLSAALFAAGAVVHVRAATQAKTAAMGGGAATATSAAAAALQVPAPVPAPTPALAPAPSASRMAFAAAATLTAPSAPALPEIALASPPAAPAALMAFRAGAAESQATFDRNLSFNGTLDLSVSTASGDITFTRGSANQIHIHGVVRANGNGDPAQVQRLAANPPIEQQGSTIRIGGHEQDLHNVSISYQIVAPADTLLNAVTASGDIADTGVGVGPKLTTASGNIKATGLQGGFKAQTASGNIAIVSAGQGGARAQTGSGDIELTGVNGALQAQTGSGAIKAVGKPTSPWKLQTGSGNIEVVTGSAPMDIDASTGSGAISALSAPSPSSLAMQSSRDQHHLRAQLNGGGPEVRAETGSGDIRID